MKSIALAAAVVACLVLATAVPPVEAATTWTARIGTSYGSATVVKGTSTRLTIAARNYRARTTYAVSLRRGSCSSSGALILGRRMMTSRYGAISSTLTLSTTQARLVRLPMAICVGARCATFKLPAPVPTPVPTPVPSPIPTPSPAPSAAPVGTPAVSIAGFAFAPATITVTAGTTVTWTNDDSASHTVTADDGAFTSDTLASGAAFSQAFASPGTFAYHCAIHPSMKGTVIVR